MEREIEQQLREWKSQEGRKPLLVRGARQVGKTYVIETFGREAFDEVITINFERQPELKQVFNSLDPLKVIGKLELASGKRMVAGKTLLFFDEIQACPKAITALRYFKEEMPELHVIGAGSLLEFAIEAGGFSFPVGRVQYLYMHPLSFREFLGAVGEHRLLQALADVTLDDPPDSFIHDRALKLVRQYLLLGGMPAVVAAYSKRQSFEEARLIQQGLIQTYQDDFGKYARRSQYDLLYLLFERAPALVGQHFKYVKIDPERRSREVKAALDLMCQAGITTRVYATAANGIPLRAEVNQRKFKLIFLDIGLLQRVFHIDPRILWEEELLQVNNGQIAEQFVGQEILATNSPYEERHLHFWAREGHGAAEVDYVVRIGSQIVPIEVKAGATGRLRSLQRFLEEKRCPLGVRISQHPLACHGKILSIPLYLVSELPRLLSSS